jgi:hypothetical protein
MHSRSISRSLILCAVLAALPVVAQAQTSRVRGMNLQGDYIKDYTGMYTYTSSVASVGNLVYGEFGDLFFPAGTPGDRSVGAVLGNLWDGRYGTWGVHLRELTPALGQGDATQSPGAGALGSDPNTHTNESFDLMWGKKFGTTSVGFRLNRSFASAEGDLAAFDPALGPFTTLKFDIFSSAITAAAANLHRNILGFGGGLGFEVNPNTSAEVALLWQSRTYELVSPAGSLEEDGAGTYLIAGRAMWQWQPNVMVMPVVKWYSFDLSTKAPAPAGVADNSLKGWQAGAAGNWTLGQNDLFVLGATFAQNKVDQQEAVVAVPVAGFVTPADGKITESIMPSIFAALETHVNSWLTLRFGANKSVYENLKIEDRAASTTAKVKASPFSMSIGAGVKLGTLQLDAVLNDTFPQTLGGFFSNAPNYVAFNRVTATYPF